jgi:hypothetical protein
MSVAALGAMAMVGAGCGSSTSTSTPPPTTPPTTPSTIAADPPAALSLTTAEVTPALRGGPGGPVSEPAAATGLRGPHNGTLAGTCGKAASPSDAQRVARRQTYYIQDGHLSASNEVVRYRTGGAEQAYREIRAAVASCPSAYKMGRGSRASHVKALAAQGGLLSKQASQSFHETQPGAPAFWEITIYQFDGDYLSAVYVDNFRYGEARSTANKLARDAAAKLRAVNGA